MLRKFFVIAILIFPFALLQAGQIGGYVTDETGAGLSKVAICLSLADTQPGKCVRKRFSGKNGGYVFKGLRGKRSYTVKVSTDSLKGSKKAKKYRNFTWSPDEQEITLKSKKSKIHGLNFTGSFTSSNFNLVRAGQIGGYVTCRSRGDTDACLVQAGQIGGYVTDETGAGLSEVPICLSLADTQPGKCVRKRLTGENGGYLFERLRGKTSYTVKVSTDSSEGSEKARKYRNYIWSPDEQGITLDSNESKIHGLNFTGSFNFSNFSPEFKLTGVNFPELTNYDLASDLVFLKIYTTDEQSSEQNLIFIGQVADINNLTIEVSVPFAVDKLHYEIYSFNAPDPIFNAISLPL